MATAPTVAAWREKAPKRSTLQGCGASPQFAKSPDGQLRRIEHRKRSGAFCMEEETMQHKIYTLEELEALDRMAKERMEEERRRASINHLGLSHKKSRLPKRQINNMAINQAKAALRNGRGRWRWNG